VTRRYFTCPVCKQGDFGGDRLLGIDGYLTNGARRMACLAGVRQAFAQAQQVLDELAGWQLDDETIRRLCHAEAARAGAARDGRDTAKAFAAEGWRDVKVAVFACR
jgi:hypothetical protein